MPSRPLSRLQVSVRLLDALNSLQRVWDARWRHICDEAGVHASQAQTLLYLAERGSVLMSELAVGLCVAPSTATRIVEQMEKAGWVARSGDPEDRRRVLIHLLDSGEERAWALQNLAQEALWPPAGDLSHPETTLMAIERLSGVLIRHD
jgi:DNA-binding MarR family transcriptional regulator